MQDSQSIENPSRPETGGSTRILIADDSRVLQRILRLILTNQPGFEVAGVANNGQECLDLAKSLHPDLITLDINMPVKDGITTLTELRKFTDIPVIIVSALPVEDDSLSIQLAELGANATVAKNFSEGPIGLATFEAELLAAVRLYQKV